MTFKSLFFLIFSLVVFQVLAQEVVDSAPSETTSQINAIVYKNSDSITIEEENKPNPFVGSWCNNGSDVKIVLAPN